jgi:O-antigen/teichoic acid export membrane protein
LQEIKKHFYHAILISVFTVVAGFSFKIFLASIIEKDVLALYYTAIDIFSFSLLILIGFRSSMVVAYAKCKKDENIINIFRYFIVILVLISWGFVIPYLKHRVGLEIHYWYLVFTILSMSSYSYLTNQLAMYRMYSLMKQSTFIEPILGAVWFLIAYYLAHTSGLKALFIMTIMSYLGLSIFIWLKKSKKVHEPHLNHIPLNDDTKTFLKNAVLSTAEFGSGILMIYTAVFFLMHYYSVEELGDFQVVTKPILMYMIMLFVFPVFRFLLPEISKYYAKNSYTDIVKLQTWFYKFSFIVSGIFVLLMVLYSQDFVALAFKPEYNGAYLYITHLSFFFVFIMLNAFQLSIIKASGAFGIALLIRISGILLFIVAFYLTRIYSQNSVSVVLGLALGYTGMFVLSFWVVKNIMITMRPKS